MYNQEIQRLKQERNISSIYNTRFSTTKNCYSQQYYQPSQKFRSIYEQTKSNQYYNQPSFNNHSQSKYVDQLEERNRNLEKKVEILQSINLRQQSTISKLKKKVKYQQDLLGDCEYQIKSIRRNYENLVGEIDMLKNRQMESKLSEIQQISSKDTQLQKQCALNEHSSSKFIEKKNTTFGPQKLQQSSHAQKDYKTFYDHLAQKIMNQQKQILKKCSKLQDSCHQLKENNAKISTKKIKNKQTKSNLENIEGLRKKTCSHRLLKPYH